MRLSDAVMLGQGLVKFKPENFLINGCGCLIGAGFAAVTGLQDGDSSKMMEMWPWLEEQYDVPAILGNVRDCFSRDNAKGIIGLLAFSIQWGEVSLEQAVDWIRSVEPAEPESVCTETVQDPVAVAQ